MKSLIETSITEGISSNVDNLALQEIVKRVNNVKAKNKLLEVHLNKCPFSGKQRIFIENENGEEFDDDSELCMLCEKPVDIDLVVYSYTEDDSMKQIIALKTEAEELLKKSSNQ